MLLWPDSNLNLKISTSLLHLGFDKFVICYNISKAHNQISLINIDKPRLCFLWYKNVSRENFELVGYKNCLLDLDAHLK